MDTGMEKKKNKSIKVSSDKNFEEENGAEDFQAIDDELQVSKEKKKKKKKKKKANGDSMSENFQEVNENEEKPLKKKNKKKTDGDETEAEGKISEKTDIYHEDVISKKTRRYFNGDGKEGFEETPSKYSGNEEARADEELAEKRKKKKKRSGEADIEEKVEITKEQEIKEEAPEEITRIRDLDIREKASKKKKKKKRNEGDGIEAVKNLEERIEDRTAKEEESTDKCHKKKKKKRAEGNGIEAVESSEEGFEDGTAKEEDNTEKSPKKRKKSSKGEVYDNVEEKEKRKKKTKKSNKWESHDNVEVKEKRKKGKKSREGEVYDNGEEKEKRTKKRKRGELVSDDANRGKSSPAERSTPSKKQKKVSFSDQVEVFVVRDTKNEEKGKDFENSAAASGEDSELVWGKRFSKAEDNAIRNAVSAYIKERGYDEEKGLEMILNCMKNSEVRNCWKQIAASLPSRPLMSVYFRAHVLYERSEERGWTEDEINALKSLHAEHGNNWKKISAFLGKSRYHVKDKWRGIKRTGLNSGHWSREEYQKLFDLVNQNLQLKSFEKEEKHTRNVLRDNINWEAIADRMETRNHVYCCKKWYYSLASSMVQTGEWENADDITLLRSLLETEASDEEAVDWNALVEGRSDVTCLKRWRQMVKHLGECHSKPFLEKLEILVKRYIPGLIE